MTNDWSLSSRTRCFAHARCTVGAITQRLREPIPLARRSLYLVTRASAHPNIRLLIRALAFVTVPTAASRLAYLIFLRLGPMFRLYFPFFYISSTNFKLITSFRRLLTKCKSFDQYFNSFSFKKADFIIAFIITDGGSVFRHTVLTFSINVYILFSFLLQHQLHFLQAVNCQW